MKTEMNGFKSVIENDRMIIFKGHPTLLRNETNEKEILRIKTELGSTKWKPNTFFSSFYGLVSKDIKKWKRKKANVAKSEARS